MRNLKCILYSILMVALMLVSSIAVFQASNPVVPDGQKADISGGNGQQEIITRVYDMFNVPLGNWWSDRYQEIVLHNSFPYTYAWYGEPSGNDWIFSDYRMNVTARNVANTTTLTDPVYVPVANPSAMGGNISLNWTANYIDGAEAAKYGGQIPIWYDSWFFRLNGTVEMDRDAAKMVLNITDSEFDDFNTWKANKFNDFKNIWDNWLLYEMNTYWPIYPAYEWQGSLLSDQYDIVKSNQTVTFQIKDCLSWGMEFLLSRMWRHSFLEFEGMPEDVQFSADIGPDHSDFDLDTAIQYSLVSKTSTRGNQPCWSFECTHGDSMAATQNTFVTGNPLPWLNNKWVNTTSEMNPYSLTPGYYNLLVANANYGSISPYDYTPWPWNLTGENDRLIIEWPSSGSIIGYNYAGTGVFTNTVTGHVDPLWIEPSPGETPSNMIVNWTGRSIELNGTFDAWSWSKSTGGCTEVRENWSRIGLMPRGAPYIEFIVNSQTTTQHHPIPVMSIDSDPIRILDSDHDYNLWPLTIGESHQLTSTGFDVDGVIVSNHWEFGDGTVIDTSNPTVTHIWTSPGQNYTVNLTVTDNDGLNSTVSRTISLIVNIPPLAMFNNPIGIIQDPYLFDASSSFDPDGSIESFNWEFGDGSTATTDVPTIYHQYSEMRNYQVNLTVADQYGFESTPYSLSVGIQTQLCAKIVAPDSAEVGQAVSINGEKSFTFDSGKAIATYCWDFGDGSGATYGMDVVHSWTAPGPYQITLMVADNAGFWSPATTSSISICDGTVSGLSLSLSRHSIFPGESANLNIKAVDDSGNKVAGSFIVDVTANRSGWSGLPAIGVALVDGEANILVSCSVIGSSNITAVIQGYPSVNGSEFATVASRTVEIRIYDFMQFPLGNDFGAKLDENYWYPSWRGKYGDEAVRYEAPVYNLYQTSGNPLQTNIDTTYRLNVDARNVDEVRMADPTFFPRMNTGTGGNVTFNWNYHYMNYSEFYWWNLENPAPMPDKAYGYDVHYTWSQEDQENFLRPSAFSLYLMSESGYDGWETFADINVTMDRSAAWQLIGLPVSEPNPVAWWNDWYAPTYSERHNDTVRNYWESTFMTNEGGGWSKAGRLDIRSSDDGYPWDSGFWGSYYTLADNGNGTVSLRIWRVGFGEESLISKWLYWGGTSNGWNYPNGTPNGLVPFEPYYDDFHMAGEFDQSSADIVIDSGVVFGFRAQKSEEASISSYTAVWRWEQTRMDYTTGYSGLWNRSEMDLWVDNGMTFQVWDPVGTAWGIDVYPDQSPNIMYLGVGESLIMEEPREVVSGLMQYPLVGDPTLTGSRAAAGFYNWMRIIEKWGNATIHPLGCIPGTALIDKGTGDLSIVGPFAPKVEYYTDSGMTWLHKRSAPLIEIWIDGAAGEYTPTSDILSPSVIITSPTSEPSCISSTMNFTISGTASDNIGVTSVTWRNEATGDSGTADGGLSWSVTGITLFEGDNLIVVTAHDSAGNNGSDSIVVNYSLTTCTITSPTLPVVYARWHQVKLTGVATDETKVVSVTWVNSASGSGTAYMTPVSGDTSVSWQTRSNIELMPGANLITVTAHDSEGNTAADNLTVIYDQTSPICTITSPTSSPTYLFCNSSISLAGIASDAVNISSITWRNQLTGLSGTANGSLENWIISWITLGNGVNPIYVNATDNAGNKATDAIFVICDYSGPIVTISGPTTNSTFTTSWHYIKLNGTATDNVKVSNVVWYNNLTGENGTAYMTPQWGAKTVIWQSRGQVHLLPGVNQITVYAYDPSGNVQTDFISVTYTGP